MVVIRVIVGIRIRFFFFLHEQYHDMTNIVTAVGLRRPWKRPAHGGCGSSGSLLLLLVVERVDLFVVLQEFLLFLMLAVQVVEALLVPDLCASLLLLLLLSTTRSSSSIRVSIYIIVVGVGVMMMMITNRLQRDDPVMVLAVWLMRATTCLLYTSPSPRD